MSVALPERSWPPHKVLLVMPDLQIFIISPPDNLIMQRSRIHFAPLRKPARDALFPDYFPALRAALYKPSRTPSIMRLSFLASSAPSSKGSKAVLVLLSGVGVCIQRFPHTHTKGVKCTFSKYWFPFLPLVSCVKPVYMSLWLCCFLPTLLASFPSLPLLPFKLPASLPSFLLSFHTFPLHVHKCFRESFSSLYVTTCILSLDEKVTSEGGLGLNNLDVH